MKTFLILLLICFYYIPLIAIGPFPVKGKIEEKDKKVIGEAHVYPKYVEIYNNENQRLGRVGVLYEQGLAKLFLVKENAERTLLGVAHKGILYDLNNNILGSFVSTPTYSFIYSPKGKRVGRVKCIAWPRVCAAGVAGYLFLLSGRALVHK